MADDLELLRGVSRRYHHCPPSRFYGVRRQSEAATALWDEEGPSSFECAAGVRKRCRAALATAVQNWHRASRHPPKRWYPQDAPVAELLKLLGQFCFCLLSSAQSD